MNLLKTLADEFSAACTACGACAAMCPALIAAGPDEAPSAIQKQVRNFLEGGPPIGTVIDRALFCNECYQCTLDTCPVQLDPMRTNLLLRGLLRDQGAWPGHDFIPPSDQESDERVLAALLTTEDEFARITTPLKKGDGRHLFFPGCNIYCMPDKLLTAMDLMDQLTDNWSFLPGLVNCCGGNHDTAGYLEEGQVAFSELSTLSIMKGFETVIFWCPTCVTKFHLTENHRSATATSFARFVTDNMADQKFKTADTGPITLHDPCKNLFLGIDPEAPRELLARLTGERVREMPRKNYCCGHGLLAGSPDAAGLWIESRLKEASDTGAGTMVNICHGCHWYFTGPEWPLHVRIVNYVTLAGRALGIRHEEKFLKWRSWGDTERIMSDIGDRVDTFPWPRSRIEEVIRKAFASQMGTGSSG
jgi:Fe-S oxidoreductase